MKTTNWTEIKTKLKMSTIEREFSAACRAHRSQPRMTHNEVRSMLAAQYGHIGTLKSLRLEIEAAF
jgi:hypothetical protein